MLGFKILKIIGSVVLAYPLVLIARPILFPEIKLKNIWTFDLILGLILIVLLVYKEIKDYRKENKQTEDFSNFSDTQQ